LLQEVELDLHHHQHLGKQEMIEKHLKELKDLKDLKELRDLKDLKELREEEALIKTLEEKEEVIHLKEAMEEMIRENQEDIIIEIRETIQETLKDEDELIIMMMDSIDLQIEAVIILLSKLKFHPQENLYTGMKSTLDIFL